MTRVTANQISGLAGHMADVACVTCVTEAPVRAGSHPPRDRFEQECVTRKDNNRQILIYLGHAVTRSRTKSGWEKKELLGGAPQAVGLIDWLPYYEERAAIREYDGGFDRSEAERLALEDTAAEYFETCRFNGEQYRREVELADWIGCRIYDWMSEKEQEALDEA
ncbi:hypothetical protein [Methylobacterium sp. P1-11]|uniref:hypothetical protein n=1 Tax=Methylobacterium sp. P1-11 TaxID=2024616 RepID=UPI0015664AD1|nr:hypothetical protein [Methylobacterium sp. P1-11]